MTHWFIRLVLVLILMPGPVGARASVSPVVDDAADRCARSMRRLTFEFKPPPRKYNDPRGELPETISSDERRALHPVLWPTDMSARLSVREWMLAKDFVCLEAGFDDLAVANARFPNGTSKQQSFIGGAHDYLDARRGMTEREMDAFIADWQAAIPGSVLAQMMHPVLLMGSAWRERGFGYAAEATSDGMRAFKALNAAAWVKVKAFDKSARDQVFGHYVALHAARDNGATQAQIRAFALDSLRRFPEETWLAVLAAERMQRKWGGSDPLFERFATEVQSVVGAERGDRAYATLYVSLVGIAELNSMPTVRMAPIRSGLRQLAEGMAARDILALQEFACVTRDADSLRVADALWTRYEQQPQLRGPSRGLDAKCREWASDLEPAR